MDLATGPRVLLVGGTSHVGKSTVAQAVAAGLGWEYQSTDRLARHPGRPWTTDRPEVREHYASLTVDALTAAQLRHYERMWPTIEALVSDEEHGLVLEGSGIWPDAVVGLPRGRVAAVWLTADPAVLRARVLATSGFVDLDPQAQAATLAFLGRTLAYQDHLTAALDRIGRSAVDVSDSPPVGGLATRIVELAELPLAARP